MQKKYSQAQELLSGLEQLQAQQPLEVFSVLKPRPAAQRPPQTGPKSHRVVTPAEEQGRVRNLARLAVGPRNVSSGILDVTHPKCVVGGPPHVQDNMGLRIAGDEQVANSHPKPTFSYQTR